eukprot:369106_1
MQICKLHHVGSLRSKHRKIAMINIIQPNIYRTEDTQYVNQKCSFLYQNKNSPIYSKPVRQSDANLLLQINNIICYHWICVKRWFNIIFDFRQICGMLSEI